jgi:hypothetical protein
MRVLLAEMLSELNYINTIKTSAQHGTGSQQTGSLLLAARLSREK